MQVEAAERRRQESENRGIKDPEKVRRMQERAAKMELEELEAAKKGMANPALRVSIKQSYHHSSVVYFSPISNQLNIFLHFFLVASGLKIIACSMSCTSEKQKNTSTVIIQQTVQLNHRFFVVLK